MVTKLFMQAIQNRPDLSLRALQQEQKTLISSETLHFQKSLYFFV